MRLPSWLWKPLRANLQAYAWAAAASALVNLLALSTSLYAMTVYDRVMPSGATASLAALVAGMSIVIVFDYLARSVRNQLLDDAGARIDLATGNALFERTLTLPLAARRGSAAAFAAALRDVESLRDLLAGATLTAFADLPFTLIYLVFLATLGGALALVPLLLMFAAAIRALFAERLLRREASRSGAARAEKSEVLAETLGALETVRACGAGPMLTRRWQAAAARASCSALSQRSAAAGATGAALSAQLLAYVLVIGLGAREVADGTLTTGTVVACSFLASRAMAPLAPLVSVLVRLEGARAAVKRLTALLGSRPQPPADPNCRATLPDAGPRPAPGERQLGTPPQAIAFEDVCFAYSDGRAVLDRCCLGIAQGERVAIVGRSGTGKSTVLRLALGLYSPSAGRVLLGAARSGLATSRPLIGACLQEIALFTGSLGENVALGRPDIDAEAVSIAGALAGLPELIGEGWASRRIGGRGEELSGGQRAAVALARALAGDPELVVLDEPGTGLDAAAEAALVARLAPWLQGRTMLLVTHRASLLQLATRVVVLEAGQITDGHRSRAGKASAPSPQSRHGGPGAGATTGATPARCATSPGWLHAQWAGVPIGSTPVRQAGPGAQPPAAARVLAP